MNNKQLTKLASAYRQSTEKRAFLGGVMRLANLLRGLGKGGLIPRAFQMSKEAPKAFSAMNSGNMLKMLSQARMPGMAAAPKLPSMVRASNIKRLQQLAKEVPGTFKNINRGNINKILPRRGGINIPGAKPPPLPGRPLPMQNYRNVPSPSLTKNPFEF